jgi:hypothetical protein
MHEHLRVVLSVDGHTQDFRVECFGASDVAAMQHDMIDPARLDHLSFLPE